MSDLILMISFKITNVSYTGHEAFFGNIAEKLKYKYDEVRGLNK